jgi:hypothetical protein
MKQVDATKNVDKKTRKFESNFVMKSEVSECDDIEGCGQFVVHLHVY